MIKKIVFLFIFSLSFFANAQTDRDSIHSKNLLANKLLLKNFDDKAVEKLVFAPWIKDNVLPYKVDNSKEIFCPPAVFQIYPDCGQQSGVYKVYSYEVNRRLNRNAKYLQNQYSPIFNILLNGKDVDHTLKTWDEMKTVGAICQKYFPYEYGNQYFVGFGYDFKVINFSGYDFFYKAMHNKLDSYYSIDTRTEDGIQLLKNWLYDGLNNSPQGGLAIVYIAIMSGITDIIMEGPEVGKHFLKSLYPFHNHSVAIVGYNDSVYYDYNQDGQITNDIDINGDGIVDVRDWEKGAFLARNSYGTNWGDSGNVYIMYRLFAETFENGNIWNNKAYIMYPKMPQQPLVTFKLKLNHIQRKCLKMSIGVSNSPDAQQPDFSIDVPFLNYTIGESSSFTSHPIDTIQPVEFGIDLTPLLPYINKNAKEVRFFLNIYENDPDNLYSGFIEDLSLLNYMTGNEQLIVSNRTSIVNNRLNTFSAKTKIEIESSSLYPNKSPILPIGEPSKFQLTAKGGSPPYYFAKNQNYTQEISNQTYTKTAELLMQDTNYYFSVAVKPKFPILLYDVVWSDSIYVNGNGSISLHNETFKWPFTYFEKSMLMSASMIAPYLSYFVFDHANHKISINNHEDFLYVRWTARNRDFESSFYDFAVTIFPSGKIDFLFYNMDNSITVPYMSGISKGDGKIATFANFFNSPQQNSNYSFTPSPIDTSFQLLPDGTVFFKSDVALTKKTPILISDNMGISSLDTLILRSGEISPIQILEVVSQSMQTAYYKGDTIVLNVKMKNLSNQNINPFTIDFTINSPNIRVLSKRNNYSIAPNETKIYESAIVLLVADKYNSDNIAELILSSSDDVFNQYILKIPLLTEGVVLDTENYSLFSPSGNELISSQVYILKVPIINNKAISLKNLRSTLLSENSSIEIVDNEWVADSLSGYSDQKMVFTIKTKENLEKGKFLNLKGELRFDNSRKIDYEIKLYANKYDKIEDYEDENNIFIFPNITNQFVSTHTIQEENANSFMQLTERTVQNPLVRKIKTNFISGGSGNIKFKINSPTNSATILHNIMINTSESSNTFTHRNSDTANWNFFKFPIKKGIDSVTIYYSCRIQGENVRVMFDDFTLPDYYSHSNFDFENNELYLKSLPNRSISAEAKIMSDALIHKPFVLQFSSPLNRNIDWISLPKTTVFVENRMFMIPINISTHGLANGRYEAVIMALAENDTKFLKVILDVSENFLNEENKIVVYPNPLSSFNLYTDLIISESGKVHFELYNLLGIKVFHQIQEVKATEGISTLRWNLSSSNALNNGLYVYRIIIGNQIFTGKILISAFSK